MHRTLIVVLAIGSLAAYSTSVDAAQAANPPHQPTSAPQGYYKGNRYMAPRGETMEQCRKRHFDRGARSFQAIAASCRRTTKKK